MASRRLASENAIVLWGLVGFFFMCLWAAFQAPAGPGGQLAAAFGALVAGGGIGAVVHRWMTRPDAIKDFYWGGTVDITRDNDERLSWEDWTIGLSRFGTVDRRAGRLRLERRLVFGLIPVGTIDKPLSDFYRVEVDTVLKERRHRSHGFQVDHHRSRPDHWDYVVRVVARNTDRLTVLTVSAPLNDKKAERLVADLRLRLERDVGSPGGTGPVGPLGRPVRRTHEAASAGNGAKKAPPQDDFEAWRARRDG